MTLLGGIDERITVPVLSSGGVRLRLHRMDEVAAVLACHTDPLGRQWAALPTAPTVEAYGGWLAEVGLRPTRALVTLAVEVEGRFAGQAGLRAAADGRSGVVFYIMAPWVRGRGVAAVAASLLTDYALITLEWSTVRWQAHVGNVASAKTAWRAGFPPPVVIPDLLDLQGRPVAGWHSEQHLPAQQPRVSWEHYLPA